MLNMSLTSALTAASVRGPSTRKPKTTTNRHNDNNNNNRNVGGSLDNSNDNTVAVDYTNNSSTTTTANRYHTNYDSDYYYGCTEADFNSANSIDLSLSKSSQKARAIDMSESGNSDSAVDTRSYYDPDTRTRTRQPPPAQNTTQQAETSRLIQGSEHGYGNESSAMMKRSSTAESDAFEDFGDGRKRRHSRITAWEASWNINNSIQGMFVVGFPYAILEGGYWALASILALGAVACYTGRVLVECLYEQDGMGNRIRVRRTYSEVAATCFGKRLGPSLVNFSQLAELLMTCVIYLVLCGDLFGDSFPQADLTIYTWILISGILVMPYASLQNIKHLAWISAACMAVHAVMMVVVLGYCMIHIPKWEWSAVSFDLNIKTIALAVGLILSSNVAQIFLPLTEENMTDSHQFWPMLKWTFVAASIMKLLFAYIPFLTFGLATKEAITNNLPSNGLKAVVNLILILKALLTYPLPYFTSIEILGDIFFAPSDDVTSDAIFPSCYGTTGQGHARIKAWAILSRLGVIIGTLLVALFVPHFSILMSFIGSFTGTMLALVWPCMFHIKLLRSQLSYWIMAFDVIVILFGFACCLIGMVSSGIALAEKYQ